MRQEDDTQELARRMRWVIGGCYFGIWALVALFAYDAYRNDSPFMESAIPFAIATAVLVEGIYRMKH